MPALRLPRYDPAPRSGEARRGSLVAERIGELVDRASHGDERAVDELLAVELPALRAFVRLRMGPALRAKESASDLVQSVCREILENAQRYQFRGEGTFRRWLFTTALRVVKNKAKYWGREKRDAAREDA